MMCGMTGLLFDYDDRGKLLVIVHGVSSSRAAGGAAAAPLLQFFSISVKVGRHSDGMLRRATSTARMGGKPLMKLMSATRRTV